jgi:hypothetical protein
MQAVHTAVWAGWVVPPKAQQYTVPISQITS